MLQFRQLALVVTALPPVTAVPTTLLQIASSRHFKGSATIRSGTWYVCHCGNAVLCCAAITGCCWLQHRPGQAQHVICSLHVKPDVSKQAIHLQHALCDVLALPTVLKRTRQPQELVLLLYAASDDMCAVVPQRK